MLLKFIIRKLVDRYGIQTINNAVADVCGDMSDEAGDDHKLERADYYDRVAEAYEKINSKFFWSIKQGK